MYSFNQRIKPAVESHVNAQLSFFNDISQTLFQSFQKISQLNLQLAQSLIEEGTQTGREIAAARKAEELVAATTSQAAPTAERLRAYRQSLTELTTQAQAALSDVAEQHVPETRRAAKELADILIQVTAEESEKALQRPQAALLEAQAQGESAVRAGRRVQADAADAVGSAANEFGNAFRNAQGDVADGAANLASKTVSAVADGAASATHAAKAVQGGVEETLRAGARGSQVSNGANQPGSVSR